MIIGVYAPLLPHLVMRAVGKTLAEGGRNGLYFLPDCRLQDTQ